MTKRNRVKRPKDELKRELKEQLQLLRRSCEVYDGGIEAAGKHIALSLRVLVHEHGQSRALLNQLGLLPSRFCDSAGPLNPKNLLPEHNLVAMRVSNTGARYVPIGDPPPGMRLTRFQDWWNQPIVKDSGGRVFSRRKLILDVADSDGGAHVDPELEEAYMALSRQNSLGWRFTSGDISRDVEGRVELACIRQIAHELLRTISKFFPDYDPLAQPPTS